ncbi:phage major capsid protein [Bacillus mobilis]|uniref:Phage major capsid protein n=1 Tax=Bacillus mobilis TaxID=2026190 RepID=A0ABV4S4M2_9BACI|nr:MULTISPECIES: phage major capsid protein [Bacillus cereus group]MCU5209219.1 phage major capsid protein [Bacillus paranthracis]MDA2164021.1 phage major capsid protein [Bacillus cereus group sp. Bc252]HDR7790931.1 phage major capsid protein [Bacillus paranthracis]
MKFTTVAEAFNFYRNHSLAEMEARAAQIKGTVDTDPNADITSINIEIEGLQQAMNNSKEKQTQAQGQNQTPTENGGMAQRSQFNPITGMQFNQGQQIPTENIFESTEYRNAFYKTMLGQKLTDIETRTFNRAMEIQEAEHRADAFNTTTNSAAVLPTTTLNEVIKKARTMGGLISHCRNFNIPTNISVPIGTPTNKAQWHVEGAPVESEKLSTAAVSFAGYEIIKVFSISAAAKKMTVQAFEAYMIEELTNCVMEAIADALVNGTGNGQGTGLVTGVTWNATNSFDLTGKYTDFTKALAMLKRGYAAGAKFAMSNATLYNKVYSLVDANGRPIFIADPKNESIGYILGKEVVIDDNLADGTIILGNLNYMGYNIPQGIMIEVSRESSFKSGLIDYRAMAIADTKPLVGEAFIKLSEKQA